MRIFWSSLLLTTALCLPTFEAEARNTFREIMMEGINDLDGGDHSSTTPYTETKTMERLERHVNTKVAKYQARADEIQASFSSLAGNAEGLRKAREDHEAALAKIHKWKFLMLPQASDRFDTLILTTANLRSLTDQFHYLHTLYEGVMAQIRAMLGMTTAVPSETAEHVGRTLQEMEGESALALREVAAAQEAVGVDHERLRRGLLGQYAPRQAATPATAEGGAEPPSILYRMAASGLRKAVRLVTTGHVFAPGDTVVASREPSREEDVQGMHESAAAGSPPPSDDASRHPPRVDGGEENHASAAETRRPPAASKDGVISAKQQQGDASNSGSVGEGEDPERH